MKLFRTPFAWSPEDAGEDAARRGAPWPVQWPARYGNQEAARRFLGQAHTQPRAWSWTPTDPAVELGCG